MFIGVGVLFRVLGGRVRRRDAPATAGRMPLRRITDTGAELVLTANPGCLLQLRAGLARTGNKRRVLHVVELLDEAYQAVESH